MSVRSKVKHFINAMIRRGYWYNSVAFRDCRKFWRYNTFNTEVVNLGSSSSVNAFCYDDIDIKAANWALSPNPLLGDLSILKNYFSYLNPQKSTVLIPLCPFSSLAGSYDYFDERYYTLLYCTTIPNYSYRQEQKVLSIKDSPARYYPLSALFSDLRYAIAGNKESKLDEKAMEKDAECRLNNWKKEFNLTSFSIPLSLINQDAINDAARILNDIISFCKDHNIRPIVLIPPVYHTLGEKLTPEIRDLIIDSLIDRIDDKSVWFHNYMDDPDYSRDISLFQNSFFLNKKGAKMFTKRVLHDIGVN